MINVLEGRDFATAGEFVTELNKARLANQRAWLGYSGSVDGRKVVIKTYDCGHLQIFRVDGIEQGAPVDMKPTAWKQFILKALER